MKTLCENLVTNRGPTEYEHERFGPELKIPQEFSFDYFRLGFRIVPRVVKIASDDTLAPVRRSKTEAQQSFAGTSNALVQDRFGLQQTIYRS